MSKRIKALSKDLFVCECMCVHLRELRRLEEGSRFPGMGVVGYELPDLCTGN